MLASQPKHLVGSLQSERGRPGALSSAMPVGGTWRGCPSMIVGGSAAACAKPALLLCRDLPRERSSEADLLLAPPAHSPPGQSECLYTQVSVSTPMTVPWGSVTWSTAPARTILIRRMTGSRHACSGKHGRQERIPARVMAWPLKAWPSDSASKKSSGA